MSNAYKNTVYVLILCAFNQPYTYTLEQPSQEELDRQLYDAASREPLNVILNLIKKGANVNAEQAYEMTPLDMAIHNPHRGVAEALLAAGARVNHVDSAGGTALDSAVLYENPAIVRLLLRAGAETDMRPNAIFFPLAMTRFSESTVNAKELLEILQLLIDYGANINARDPHDRTALQLATANSSDNLTAAFQVIFFLLEHGAAIDLDNAKLQKIITELIGFPLGTAAAMGNLKEVTAILQTIPSKIRAENIALQQGEPLTLVQRIMAYFPSLRACFSGQRQCVNINQQDRRGFTALHWAAAQGNPQIAHALLQAGANFRITNNEHLTPLQLAERNLHEARQRGDSEAERRYQEIIDSIDNFRNLKTTKEILAQAFRTIPREQARTAYGEFNPEEIIKHIIEYQMARPPAAASASHAP